MGAVTTTIRCSFDVPGPEATNVDVSEVFSKSKLYNLVSHNEHGVHSERNLFFYLAAKNYQYSLTIRHHP